MYFPDYLRDKLAIEQVYYRYCELVDAKAFHRLDEVFTPDTISDFTRRYAPTMVCEGLLSLMELMTRHLGPDSDCGATHHNVFNVSVTVRGDTAESKAHFYVVHQGRATYSGSLCSLWGEYRDYWLRTMVGWRILRRTHITSLSEGAGMLNGSAFAVDSEQR